MGIQSAWLQGPGSVLQAGRPLVPLLVTCSLGEEAASWTSSLLVAGCSRLCPLPRSTRSLGTGHPRVVTLGGGWTEEAFCLGCTFLPSLWGGQQRNPINTQCVGGGETAAFVRPSGVPGSTHSSVSGPWSFPEGTRTRAHSCQ